jgi:hydroxymethylglutaryl-CoA synthase
MDTSATLYEELIMRIGILDFGTYIPHYRVSRAAMGAAWRLEQAMPLLIGERSVAGYDEDSMTMAAEAALHALTGQEGAPVDALYFTSTTPPFGEKAAAPVVAMACDLDVARALDVTDSLRAGTAALSLAFDALKAGTARQALVAAADMRRGEPGSLLEAFSGDGAAALLLGSGDGVLAELVGAFHLSDPVIDTWRRSGSRYLHTDDEAYTSEVGYFALVDRAVRGLLQVTGVEGSAVGGTAVYTPDGRAYLRLAKSSPLAASFARMGKTAPALRLLMDAGNLGAAFPLAQLGLLLETAVPGDLLALVGYGDGADAYLFRVTEAIAQRPAKRLTQTWLDSKTELSVAHGQRLPLRCGW